MSCKPADAAIHLGALAPYAFRYDATSVDATNFDLSTATAAEFRVRRENGRTVVWPATLSNQSTTTASATHVFVSGDLDRLEQLALTPVFTTPSGEFFCESKTLDVKRPDQL